MEAVGNWKRFKSVDACAKAFFKAAEYGLSITAGALGKACRFLSSRLVFTAVCALAVKQTSAQASNNNPVLLLRQIIAVKWTKL